MTGGLALIWPVTTAAFLASLVEAVEALTIVLAVATVRGWRPPGLGALAGLAVLALIVAGLGPLLGHVPLRLLQFVIGVLLLLFGMRWLRKAILRAAGVIPLHDEAKAFATETAELREQARRNEARLDWIAGLTTFKAVLLEGLEVVFIVIALGAGRGMLVPASVGAAAACLSVAGIGLVVHRPLARVPENTLKFAVGVIALHDEEAAFSKETAALHQQANDRRADYLAGLASFKAVLLEGVEVVFIVIAVGAAHGQTLYASLGALAAFILVMLIGLAVHRPLARVPENALKFVVGLMLTSFGVFWTGEGLGAEWPGADLTLIAILAVLAAFAFAAVRRLRSISTPITEGPAH